MLIQILKSKIQQLIVSESCIDYPGSISLPDALLCAANIKPFELVYVNNKTNGNRITTYAVKNKTTQKVTINGAASKLFQQGDVIHVLTFAQVNLEEAEKHRPIIVVTDQNNCVIEQREYSL